MDLDDIAAAALFSLSGRSPKREKLDVVYQDPGTGDLRTPESSRQVGSSSSARGAFSVPQGSLRAAVHNHPPGKDNEWFSPEDIATAKRLGVPVYIDVMNDRGGEIRRFDPNKPSAITPKIGGGYSLGEPVLAEIPIEEMKRQLFAKGLRK
jgi:hypothetical protein